MAFRRNNNKKLILYFILLLLAAGFIYFFLHAGKYLVRSDELINSDVIVVLMGSGPDRMLEAVDLYKAGYGKKILMVENNQPGYDLLEKRGVSLPRDPYLAKSVGMQLGVPEGAFIILPGDALSTQDEARHVREYLREHQNIKTMLLVSSRYHTARAYKIFSRAMKDLKPEVRIMSRPSRYDTFKADTWWESREDAKHVVDEYLKLLAFYTLDRW